MRTSLSAKWCCAVVPLLVASLAVTLVMANGTSPTSFSDQTLYWNHGPWESPPPETGITNQRTTATRIIRITRDRHFEMIGCLVRETPAGTAISPGDGQTIWLGTVHESKGKLLVHYRLVMDIAGVVKKSPEEQRDLALKGPTLTFDGASYDAVTTIELKDFLDYINEYHAEAKRAQTP